MLCIEFRVQYRLVVNYASKMATMLFLSDARILKAFFCARAVNIFGFQEHVCSCVNHELRKQSQVNERTKDFIFSNLNIQ